jgi:hypothetical protein
MTPSRSLHPYLARAFTYQRTETLGINLSRREIWRLGAHTLALNWVRTSFPSFAALDVANPTIALLACCEVARHPSVRTGDSRGHQYQDSDFLVDGQNQLPRGALLSSGSLCSPHPCLANILKQQAMWLLINPSL